MGSAPKRIQRRRTKGWKMPSGAVYVGRPGRWGNPWRVGIDGSHGWCVEQHRRWLTGEEVEKWPLKWIEENRVPKKNGYRPATRITIKMRLRGKDLACWCPLVDKDGKPVPCHANVLLELANPPQNQIHEHRE